MKFFSFSFFKVVLKIKEISSAEKHENVVIKICANRRCYHFMKNLIERLEILFDLKFFVFDENINQYYEFMYKEDFGNKSGSSKRAFQINFDLF